MWEPITLVAKVPEVNENGVNVFTAHTKDVSGDRGAVTRSEYYIALKSGEQAQIIFTLWVAEFLEASVTVEKNGNKLVYEPTELICGGIRYKIGRTYNKPGSDKMELTCSKIM